MILYFTPNFPYSMNSQTSILPLKSSVIFLILFFFFFLQQLDSEKERAALLSRAAVAEAQVSELQDYVNNHLSRSGGHYVFF